MDNFTCTNANMVMHEMAKQLVLQTGTDFLDGILAPCIKGQGRQAPITGGGSEHVSRGGLIPGILHVIAGPQHALSRVLMKIAVVAQLSPVQGGINASRVFYIELNNHFDPYLVSNFARTWGLTPSRVLDRIEIARGFNWDQAVELVSTTLPEKVVPRSVVLISGLTAGFNPADPTHYEGLRAMIDGVKRCFHQPNMYLLATTPVADGSTFKPRGGHNLAHFAGCILSMSAPVVTRSGSTFFNLELHQHPLLPERRLRCWDHSKAREKQARKTRRAIRNDLSTFRMLEDFT